MPVNRKMRENFEQLSTVSYCRELSPSVFQGDHAELWSVFGIIFFTVCGFLKETPTKAFNSSCAADLVPEF